MAFDIFKRSDRLYWIWLALRLGNRNPMLQDLLDAFGGSPHEIYRADETALSRAKNIPQAQLRSLLNKDVKEAMSILSFCQSNGVGIMCYTDKIYPESVKRIKDPPIVMYYMGDLPDLNGTVCVSVVGTRKMTEYGMRSCYKIAYELASAGVTVISGMALGIDSMAHAGAMGGRGKTVAVLGCGIDVIYPKQHRQLRRYICEHGAIITSYHPGTPAYRSNFPERNSLISALGEGTLVVEAPAHSGALITAEHAAEQSRVIYALPGSIEEPMSEGPNELIKNGAVAVTCARDILTYYFESGSKLVDPIRLRQGELSSEFDKDILATLGISSTCYGRGPVGTPAAMLKKLNDQLNNNQEINSEYYTIPNIKKIDGSTAPSKKTSTSARRSPKKTAEKADTAKTAERTQTRDISATLDSLTEEQRSVFSDIPCDKPVSVDTLVKSGHSIGTLMATLTVLEIKGLVSSLPGGMYIRK